MKVGLMVAFLIIVSLCLIFLTYLSFSTFLQREQLRTEYHPINKVSIPIDVPSASREGKHGVEVEHHDFP